jgi:hypothetical protein
LRARATNDRESHRCAGGMATSTQHGRCASIPRVRSYRPSSIESAWYERPATGRICELTKSAAQQDAAEVWLNFTQSTWRLAANGMAEPKPDATVRTVLSHFEYEDGSVEFVEPLTGVARNPRAPVGCMPGDASARYHNPSRFMQLFDIRYLLPANACTGDAAQPRVGCRRKTRFYDLGCTTYLGHKGDFAQKLEGQARGKRVGGPSVPLFSEIYRRRCLPFDEVYAWDSSTDVHQQPERWYANVPSELHSKIHYFNRAIRTQALDGAQHTREAKSSPRGNRTGWRRFAEQGDFFNTLLTTASPSDFVVVKLDIEGQSGGPEVAIAETIAAMPELSHLIDEFYFEYHFYFDGRNFGWGSLPKPTADKPGPDVDSALSLMARLRKAGVRAHFWI